MSGVVRLVLAAALATLALQLPLPAAKLAPLLFVVSLALWWCTASPAEKKTPRLPLAPTGKTHSGIAAAENGSLAAGLTSRPSSPALGSDSASWCPKGLDWCCVVRAKPGPTPGTDGAFAEEAVSPAWRGESSPDLAWTTPEEEKETAEFLALLTAEERNLLEAQPEDIRHPLFFTRLLRGHGSPQNAADACRRMLVWRQENAELIRTVRSSIPKDVASFDRSFIHGHQEAPYEHIGVECSVGSWDGLPISLIPLRTFSAEGWHAWGDEGMMHYFVGALEQYTMVLHNQSLKQRRMVKMNEIRDGSGLSPSAFFGNPVKSFAKFRRLAPMAANYPEVVNKFVIFNASPSWIRLCDWMRSLTKQWFDKWFKEDMSDDAFKKNDGKLQLVKTGDWESLVGFLKARGIQRWADSVVSSDDAVGAGCMGVRCIWLRKGQSCRWSLASDHGLGVEALFFPAIGGVERLADSPGEGHHSALQGEGAVLLTADNTNSWYRSQHAALRLFPDAKS